MTMNQQKSCLAPADGQVATPTRSNNSGSSTPSSTESNKASFTFARNFSILTFNGGGYLLQGEGGYYARAFSDLFALIDFLIEEKDKLVTSATRFREPIQND
jgi:hypothetical protein